MATVFYDKAAVKVSFGVASETLLANNCTINYSSSQQPLYAIGSKGTLGQFPSAARVGDISFGFLTSITGLHHGYRGNIINTIASGVKNSVNSEVSGVQIECAGITGYGFLNSYSFNVASNAISTSNASFTFFGSGSATPISGYLINTKTPMPIATGVLATGIAHGKTTSLGPLKTTISAAGTPPGPVGGDSANVFGADYSLSLNHNPVYKVGQEFPMMSFYTTAQESVNVTEDVFDKALAFNEGAGDITLSLAGLGADTWYQKVGITGATQINTSMTAGLDDIVRTQKTLTAAY